jgi:hypothetical protein
MMALHAELSEFQRRLESSGAVVAAHADHLCVRLPMLISLRVRYDGERLSFDLRYGIVSRAVATTGVLVAANAVIVGAVVTGAALPVVVAVSAIGVLAGVYETMRYVVTESAISRVALLWGTRPGASAPAQLAGGSAWPPDRAPAETVRASRHVE